MAEKPELPEGVKAGAFCGIGQPESFRRTLAGLGVELEFFRAFPDHWRYREQEVEEMLRLAPLLLTTEKDLLNLPPTVRAHPAVRAVPVRLEIRGGAELLEQILGVIGAGGAGRARA